MVKNRPPKRKNIVDPTNIAAKILRRENIALSLSALLEKVNASQDMISPISLSSLHNELNLDGRFIFLKGLGWMLKTQVADLEKELDGIDLLEDNYQPQKTDYAWLNIELEGDLDEEEEEDEEELLVPYDSDLDLDNVDDLDADLDDDVEHDDDDKINDIDDELDIDEEDDDDIEESLLEYTEEDLIEDEDDDFDPEFLIDDEAELDDDEEEEDEPFGGWTLC